MDTGTLKRYIELDRREKQLKAELSTVREERDALQEQLLDQFAADGIQNMQIDGRTVYIHRQLWARQGEDKQACIDTLRQLGYEHLCYEAFNTQSVSAVVRELEKEGAIPDELTETFKITEDYSLRVRNA